MSGSNAIEQRILGSVIGAAAGDAVGAPLELCDRSEVGRRAGGFDWIDDMPPYRGVGTHPYGVWEPDPPKGTGTDDTRLNHVFIEAVIERGPGLDSRLLAEEYIGRHARADELHPDHRDLAVAQFELLLPDACGFLERECPMYPSVPPFALRDGMRQAIGAPHCLGLLALPSVGLLHPGDPEAAYRHAYELDFIDIGYARDAVALLAAMVAAGLDGDLTPREAIMVGLETDPFRLEHAGFVAGELLWPRIVPLEIRRFVEMAEGASSDRAFVDDMSRAARARGVFDPIDQLGMAVASAYRADGDPRRAILMAANHRDIDDAGEFLRFRDTDCTGSICGALVGALAPDGVDAIPADWTRAVVAANREVHGLDIEANARELAKVIAG